MVATQPPHRNTLVVMVDNDIVAETVPKDNHMTKWLGLAALIYIEDRISRERLAKRQ